MVRAQPGYKKTKGGPALPRPLPYSGVVKDMEDYYPNLDGRYGYCFCGCGEQTTTVKHTNAARGHFEGEPHSFLRGHHIRLNRPIPASLTDEEVSRIRGLWRSSALSGGEIGEVVGRGSALGRALSGSYIRAIAQNEAYHDPDYRPPTHEERADTLYGRVDKECPECGKALAVRPHRLKRNLQVTCGSPPCKEAYQRHSIARRSRERQWTQEERVSASELASARWASGVYAEAKRPPTRLQREWAGRLPEERPDFVEPHHWKAIRLHVVEGMSYEEIARLLGSAAHLPKYRAKRAAEDLDRGAPRPIDTTRKKEAARRRWRNARGEFEENG